MSIFNNEDGVVQIDIILVVFSVLFILASLVVLSGHNLILAPILFLIGVTLYPLGKRAISYLSGLRSRES